MTHHEFRKAYSQVRYFRNREAGPPAPENRLNGFSLAHRCWFKREVHKIETRYTYAEVKVLLATDPQGFEYFKKYLREDLKNHPTQPLPLP